THFAGAADARGQFAQDRRELSRNDRSRSVRSDEGRRNNFPSGNRAREGKTRRSRAQVGVEALAAASACRDRGLWHKRRYAFALSTESKYVFSCQRKSPFQMLRI